MNLGSTLLELQELDLALIRDKALLAELPELKELAKKRRMYQKLKAKQTELFAKRKDIETDLEDLDILEKRAHFGVERAHLDTDKTDYRQVKELELQLSNFAKDLDKVEFGRKEHGAKLEQARAEEAKLAEYIAKFEDAVRADAAKAKARAEELQRQIAENEKKRAELAAALDPAMLKRYERAAVSFKGIAVERLENGVPSSCRMALTSASLDDLKHTGEVGECPYCHRILVTSVEEL